MPRPVEGNSRYMAGMDGLRAIAVLAVIAYHLNVGWASGGLLGVGVFFVLSGYLITNLLVAERERYGHIRFKNFWFRRARRLLPALFIMLVVVNFNHPAGKLFYGDQVAAPVWKHVAEYLFKYWKIKPYAGPDNGAKPFHRP